MNPETIQFIVTYMMVLLTLACAYLGLRLVKQDWKLRLALIIVPLLGAPVIVLLVLLVFILADIRDSRKKRGGSP